MGEENIKAPVPSQVKGFPLPKPAEPKAKLDEDGLPIPAPETLNEAIEEDIDLEDAADANEGGEAIEKGTIKITVYKDKPYEVEFTGFISGSELDLGWRFMMKKYRVWKHTMFKKQEEDNKGGSDV